MKILHVNTYDHGGAAIAAIRLHKALLAQGVDSSMLFMTKTNNNIPSSYAMDESRKYKPFIIKLLIRAKYKLLSELTLRHNEKKLKNRAEGLEMFSFNYSYFDFTTSKIYKEADIIHLHWIAGFVNYKVFKKINKPVIWTLHDMNPFTGGCHYSNGCEKYKNECRDCPQLFGTKNMNYSLIDQIYKKSFLAKISAIITAPSIWLNDCSSNSALFKKFQNFHIPNSLDISTFKPLNKAFSRLVLNLPPDKNILLFISDRIENKRKGFDLLINALMQINQSNIHVCAIGNRNKDEIFVFESTFLNGISDERILALAYSAADVFVLPSREDNLPNVMLESLGCGTPVIAFPFGGMLDVIKNGFNGILAKDFTFASLADAINEFLEDKYKFDSNEISENARQNFSPFLQANRYVTLYQNIRNSNQNAE